MAKAIANREKVKAQMPEELKEYFANGGELVIESEEWATIEHMAILRNK